MSNQLAGAPDQKRVPPARHPAAIYLASLAKTGRRAMRSRLNRMARLLGYDRWDAVPWQALRYDQVAGIIVQLQESGEAPASTNLALSALRGTTKAAFNLGLLAANDLARIQSIRRVSGERLPRGRAVTAGELRALMQACAADSGPAGARDAAILAVLYAGGLRRAEVVALDVESHDPETGELVVRGKGDKVRKVWIQGQAAEALADWLAVRGKQMGPLFLRLARGRHPPHRRLTPQAVYDLLRKRARQAGVKPFSPHDLRRSFVGTLLDAGVDLATVQALAGHASPATTSRYDRRPEEVRKQAQGLLNLPYERPLGGAGAER